MTKKRIGDIRLEIRAVTERWPIPRAIRERMVYDAFKVTQDNTQEIRARLAAAELLRRMARDSSSISELPQQVEVEETAPGQETVDVQDIVRELKNDPKVIDALDFRVYKPTDNKTDYAE